MSDLGDAITGTRGTLVFGNGVTALKVEIVGVAGDVIHADIWDVESAARIVVPASSVVYYRLAD